MDYQQEEHRLLKFFAISAFFLFVGTVHGVLQIQRPIRAWLDSIGSPYGGPGHMIDPLAHAHVNLIGGVTIFAMAAIYFFIPRISGKCLFSYKLVEHSFWWTVLGLIGFYSTLMTFGILEGFALLNEGEQAVAHLHHYYSYIIAIVSTIMGIGFWIYFYNVFRSFSLARKKS
jgi:cytochrome c oxidase cbb3-type subunit 1